MDKSVISANFITYQCLFLDYPLEASIRSCMDLCEDAYINDGGSNDGTLDVLYHLQSEYGTDRIKIFERRWVHDRGFWARERNFNIDKMPKTNYVLNIAADECIHENDIARIKECVSKLHGRALRFIPIHFYGLPKYIIYGPHWAKILSKLWQVGTGARYYNIPGGCADDPLWPNRTSVHFNNCYVTNIPVYHYGHCRDPKAVAMKNEKAHSLYRGENSYHDGSFPTITYFDYELEKYMSQNSIDKVVLFQGTHPKYMEEWCERHKDQKLSYGL